MAQDITHFCVEDISGGRGDVAALWLQADQLYIVSVDLLGLAFKFDVFTLTVNTSAEMLSAMRANAPQMDRMREEMREAGLALPSIEPPVELSPAGALSPWAFRSWRLDILKRNEFIVDPEHLPETAEAVERYFASLGPGEAPVGSEHTCLTDIGLLFTSAEGGRFLVVADGSPGFMRVADDEETVQAYLQQCIAVPVGDHASSL